jgi:hypothetical protein
MMAMASNRLVKYFEPDIKMEFICEIRDEHGGSSQPEECQSIRRIPSIAALERLGKN